MFVVNIIKRRFRHKTATITGILLCCGFLLPFILLQDFLPFYRFGMFAEPFSSPAQQEYFIVTYQTAKNEIRTFYAPEAGLNAGHYEYLKRNYYYRQQGELLLQRTRELLPEGQTEEWCLKRLVKNGTLTDTLDQIWLK